MGTRIVVMKSGLIQQVAQPQELYDYPANMFVAGFIGTPQMNFMPGKLEKTANGLFFTTRRWRLPVDGHYGSAITNSAHSDREVMLGIRPEHVLLESEATALKEAWAVQAKVEMKEMMGADTYLYAETGHGQLIVRANAHTPVGVGDEVRIRLNMDKAHLFDIHSGEALMREGRG
ncbi:hypothetical protein PA598K_00004 [Paenibacillus sp. 598K]|nr:hypothetical protein PA598K_00004 [Paenibacillus sp. 598K]